VRKLNYPFKLKNATCIINSIQLGKIAKNIIY